MSGAIGVRSPRPTGAPSALLSTATKACVCRAYACAQWHKNAIGGQHAHAHAKFSMHAHTHAHAHPHAHTHA
eukprot:2182572-Prymnesium_polylepis.1